MRRRNFLVITSFGLLNRRRLRRWWDRKISPVIQMRARFIPRNDICPTFLWWLNVYLPFPRVMRLFSFKLGLGWSSLFVSRESFRQVYPKLCLNILAMFIHLIITKFRITNPYHQSPSSSSSSSASQLARFCRHRCRRRWEMVSGWWGWRTDRLTSSNKCSFDEWIPQR